MNFSKLPGVIVLDVFFFLHNSVSLYINVATICEWCEQMLGIPVLCRGLKLPSYPCEEPLPFCERLQGLRLCSSKLVDWHDNFFLFVFKCCWLTLKFSLWDKSKVWFSQILCCTFLWSGQGFNAWSDKNSSKTAVGSSLAEFPTTRRETENKLLTY